jgi:lipoate-protein ligase A
LDSLKFQLRENDYVIGDHKIGGNAQTISRNRWLHHTSFLWDYNIENMNYLKLPKKKPNYRGERDHHNFLSKLCTHISSKDELQNSILSSISNSYDIDEISFDTFYSYIEQLLANRSIDTLAKSIKVDTVDLRNLIQ